MTELVSRLHDREAKRPVPPQRQLRLAPPRPPPPETGTFLRCANQCLTKSKTPKHANKLCVSQLCSDCCAKAARDAETARVEREACKVHHQPSVSGAPSHTSQHSTAETHGVSLPLSQESASHQIPPSTPLETRITSQHRSISPEPGPSQRRSNGRSGLARPLPPSWAASYRAAEDAQSQRESLKAKSHRLAEDQKKTVELVLYHSEDQPPVILDHRVDTYPNLCVTDLKYLAQFGVAEDSWIDIFMDGTFKTFRTGAGGITTVERGRQLLIRLRRSALEELPIARCPGIDSLITRQSKGRSRGSKRAADAQSNVHFTMSSSPDIEFPEPSEPLPASHPPASLKRSQKNLPVSTQSKYKGKGRKHRQWPDNFYVCEVVDGLREVKEMKDRNKKSKLEDNFKAVFGVPYKKTSEWKYRGWIDSDDKVLQDIIAGFVAQGSNDGALWTKFKEASEQHRAVLEKKKAHNDLDSSSGTESDPGAGPFEPSHYPDYLDLSDSNSSPSDDSDGDLSDILCFFCDEPLPTRPTQALLDQASALELLTKPDPMPHNPRRRTASTFTIYQDYCARHRMEREELPFAHLEGWPETPDLSALFDRVVALRHQLDPNILATSHNEFFSRTVKRFANVQTSHIHGIGNFRGHGAGYYGNEGAAILAVTLQFLFPEERLPANQPLPYAIFLREVLGREAARQLIQQDLGLSPEKAARTLQSSERYGTMLHPGDGDTPALDAVITKIAKQKQESQGSSIKQEISDGEWLFGDGYKVHNDGVIEILD
ncbi:hypothetical protein HWV62_27365 [Athelia sp. TMB]|nr:hypothetical protein HWV62_27365 [Athelia sp. TMB]